MNTHPKFDRNPKGNFALEHAFTQVVFGSDSMLLEDDLNEMQAIQQHLVRPLYDQNDYDGLKSYPQYYKIEDDVEDTLVIPEFFVQVNGRIIRVAGVGNDGKLAEIPSTSNLIVTEKVESGWGILYLEVKEVVVCADDTLYENGVQGTNFRLANKLADPRFGQETTRRLQMQSTLRVQNGVAHSMENMAAMSLVQDPEGSLYVYDQNGRWRSENNYFAVPLGLIFVETTDPFNPAYSELRLLHQQVDLSYNELGDVTTVVTRIGDFELCRVNIRYSDYFVNSFTQIKDGRETLFSIGSTWAGGSIGIGNINKMGF